MCGTMDWTDSGGLPEGMFFGAGQSQGNTHRSICQGKFEDKERSGTGELELDRLIFHDLVKKVSSDI